MAARRSGPSPEGRTVHEMFARQVERSPRAVAVTSPEASLTYEELDRQADRVARHLRGLGCRPGTLVGLLVGRSASMMVGILGILKSGAAYLPLEPSYPVERLRFMLEDSGAPVLVTENHLGGLLPGAQATVVLVDTDLGDGSGVSLVDYQAGPEDLSYVIYTSGSTGRPKGVEIRHRSVVNLLQCMATAPGLSAGEVLVALTTPAFDLSVPDLFLPLVTGARMVIVDPEVAGDGRRLARVVDECCADLMQATPSTWQMLLDAGWEGRPGLRAVCGGEVLPVALADQLVQRGLDVWNMYGPTEATVWATALHVTTTGQPIGLGSPLVNTSVHILDEALAPVPIGATGELHIGGVGLARGYLNRPELTEKHFVPDPFDPSPGARLYKTGDLACRRPDGRLDFLGRADSQVKVRGFRIELGEIENRLGSHPALRGAVVVARPAPSGDARLVAYVRGRSQVPSVEDLRAHLAGALPEYMVPATFVALDAFPLTPNGKVDRSALPPPPATRPALGSAYLAPRTDVEHLLAEVFSEILGVAPVGVDDDFFALGGHSLLVAQAVAVIRDRCGQHIDLGDLFEKRTVGALAAYLGARIPSEAGDSGPSLVRLKRPASGELKVPLSLVQQQMWSMLGELPDPALYGVTAVVPLPGGLDEDALHSALSFLVDRHESLRTRFPRDEAYQLVGSASTIEIASTDLRDLTRGEAEAELARVIRLERALPFDRSGAAAPRAHAIRLSDQDSRLIWSFDHLAMDETSLAMLRTELCLAYGAARRGTCPHLVPPPLQYADFASWERAWMTRERVERHVSYWRQKLRGIPGTFPLPYDRDLPAGASALPADPSIPPGRISFALAPATYGDLTALARTRRSSFHIVVTAAVKALLSRWSGEDDIVVGTAYAGRHRPELEAMVGLFAGIAVLRTDVSGDPTFDVVLERVHATQLELLEHQPLPFLRVLQELEDAGDASPLNLGAVPVDIQFFRAASDQWTQGVNVIAHPPGGDEPATSQVPEPSKPLGLHFFDNGQRLWAELSYQRERFDDDTARGFVSDLLGMLDAVSVDPSLRISDLSLALLSP